MATRQGPKQPTTARWQNRIVGHGLVAATDLQANPANARVHGPAQRAAMADILDDVGFVASVIVNRTTGLILDGHMRVELAAANGEQVPVDYVELSVDEERKMLALLDPIGAMATMNTDALADLTQGLGLSSDLQNVLDDLLPSPDTEPAQPLRTTELKPLANVFVLVTCPIDRWEEVGPLLDQLALTEGIDIRSNVK